jgi:hypothetical protein
MLQLLVLFVYLVAFALLGTNDPRGATLTPVFAGAGGGFGPNGVSAPAPSPPTAHADSDAGGGFDPDGLR